MVWRGCQGVSADRRLSSPFFHSPLALGERHRPLSPFHGSSDHPHPAICKGADDITRDPASAVLLLALQSQGEAQLSWGKWLSLIKDGSTSPVSWWPWHRECPGQAEKTGSLLASPAAHRRTHPSAALAPVMFYKFNPWVSRKRSHVCSHPGQVFSLGGQRAKGKFS